MKRLLSLLLLSLLTVVICTTRTSSQSTSDEETLKKLEIEGTKHAGTSDADIAFGKSINAEHVVTVDPLGHVSDQTPGDVEKMSLGIRKADPDVKASGEIQEESSFLRQPVTQRQRSRIPFGGLVALKPTRYSTLRPSQY